MTSPFCPSLHSHPPHCMWGPHLPHGTNTTCLHVSVQRLLSSLQLSKQKIKKWGQQSSLRFCVSWGLQPSFLSTHVFLIKISSCEERKWFCWLYWSHKCLSSLADLFGHTWTILRVAKISARGQCLEAIWRRSSYWCSALTATPCRALQLKI